MSELPGQANITGRVDARVGGLETIVYQHAFARIVLDTHSLQIEPFDVRRTAGPGQDLIHNDRLLLSLLLIAYTFLAAIPLDASNPGIEPHSHTLTDESALHNRGSVHVLAVEQVRILVEEADLGTEPLKGLRQFTANGSATDHCQPGRTLGKVEHGFIGQVAGLSQSRDRRLLGSRAGRDDRPSEPQRLSFDLNRIRTGETGRAEEHIHTQLREALR